MCEILTYEKIDMYNDDGFEMSMLLDRIEDEIDVSPCGYSENIDKVTLMFDVYIGDDEKSILNDIMLSWDYRLV